MFDLETMNRLNREAQERELDREFNIAMKALWLYGGILKELQLLGSKKGGDITNA